MRPRVRPPTNSRTSTFPRRKRASATVLSGIAERNSGATMLISRDYQHTWIIVTRSPPFKSHSVALPIVLLVVAMASFQLGAVVAKQLFAVVGVAGATALRLGLSSVILLAAWRPWRVRLSFSEARSIGIYGLAMGLMNLFFYASLDRIPLGIAVALEFTGPLAVAMAASRRPIDFVWIALAAFGLIAILPLGSGSQRLDPVGIGFALAAGACWPIYLVFGQKPGNAHGGQTTALGTAPRAIVILPTGIRHPVPALVFPPP